MGYWLLGFHDVRQYDEQREIRVKRKIKRYLWDKAEADRKRNPPVVQKGQMVLPGFEGIMGFDVVGS